MRTFALVAFVAAGALSCSSSETPPTSGGASFQLQGADPTAAMGLSTMCPDGGGQFLIASGDVSDPKLLTDGADGATAKCKIDGTHFELSVSNKNGSVSLSGTYAGTESKDAKSVIVTPSNVYISTSTEVCNVHFDAASGGGVVDTDGKISAKFDCPAIKHRLTETACAIAPGAAFFKFSNCQGF